MHAGRSREDEPTRMEKGAEETMLRERTAEEAGAGWNGWKLFRSARRRAAMHSAHLRSMRVTELSLERANKDERAFLSSRDIVLPIFLWTGLDVAIQRFLSFPAGDDDGRTPRAPRYSRTRVLHLEHWFRYAKGDMYLSPFAFERESKGEWRPSLLRRIKDPVLNAWNNNSIHWSVSRKLVRVTEYNDEISLWCRRTAAPVSNSSTHRENQVFEYCKRLTYT